MLLLALIILSFVHAPLTIITSFWDQEHYCQTKQLLLTDLNHLIHAVHLLLFLLDFSFQFVAFQEVTHRA